MKKILKLVAYSRKLENSTTKESTNLIPQTPPPLQPAQPPRPPTHPIVRHFRPFLPVVKTLSRSASARFRRAMCPQIRLSCRYPASESASRRSPPPQNALFTCSESHVGAAAAVKMDTSNFFRRR
ncbi:hypothetical protein Zmor_012879 [Zophobas morio]|uniref:Uncharacterized protein n=1 Tax=Zophobas morio TaxID=2755281 RepID=A0AA38IGT6_9CUCU|nr:hypothetical protein Zmor_012879 [Zophobas morio]